MSGDERIHVGSKPILAYVTAVVTSLKSESVRVMARGRDISTAVDVVEVTKRSFLTDLVIGGIDIGTERFGEAGAERNVSTISIQLTKPKA